MRNLLNCVQRCHLDVAGIVVSPYASGLACLAEDEMELGVTVVDMGGGTTSIAVFFEGKVIYTAVPRSAACTSPTTSPAAFRRRWPTPSA